MKYLSVRIGSTWVSFYQPSQAAPSGLAYPRLIKIPDVTETTTSQLGNSSAQLLMNAQDIIGIPIGSVARIVDDGGMVVFAGIVKRVIFEREMTLELEA